MNTGLMSLSFNDTELLAKVPVDRHASDCSACSGDCPCDCTDSGDCNCACT